MSDPFDDTLRSRFGATAEPYLDAPAVLSGLTPTLRRARRAAQIRSGVTGLAVALASSGVAAVLLMGGGADPEETVVAVPPTDPVASSTSVTSESDLPTIVAPVSPKPEGATSTTTTTASDATTAATAVETTVPPRSTTPETAPQTTLPSTTVTSSASVSPSTTARNSTTTTQGTNTTVIESACGSIEVATSGENITLLDVAADPGYEIDEKDDGPENVEVSFEGPGGHCEIKAEVRNGVLWTDVSSE